MKVITVTTKSAILPATALLKATNKLRNKPVGQQCYVKAKNGARLFVKDETNTVKVVK